MMAGFQAEENLTGRAKKMCEKLWTLSRHMPVHREEHEPDLPGLQQHRKNVARMRVREGSLPAS